MITYMDPDGTIRTRAYTQTYLGGSDARMFHE